eukprot:CCRYP_005064-RA/>CCRYP_005064-RA protein AED:0.10 eAED:0.10 QI:0/-1/0/1/-1/1/1/0/372
MDKQSIDVNFICPVCQKLPFAHPVLAEDGFIYHEECIKKYIYDEKPVLISPMTGRELGSRLTFSKAIESTLRDIERCDRDCMGVDIKADKKLSETIVNAKIGDLTSMTTLGRWYLFGERRGIDKDEPRGYGLVKQAAEGNDEAKAYVGHCLIRGLGVEKNREEGHKLLVETATEGRGIGRGKWLRWLFRDEICLNATTSDCLLGVETDFAAYTLGFCYREGLQGFKCDKKRATKWLGRVIEKPDDLVIWGYKYDDDSDHCLPPQHDTRPGSTSTPQVKQDGGDGSDDGIHCESTRQKKLLSENESPSAATTISTNQNSNKFYLNSASISETTSEKCEVCLGIFELKDMMGTRCHDCAYLDFSRLLGLDVLES